MVLEWILRGIAFCLAPRMWRDECFPEALQYGIGLAADTVDDWIRWQPDEHLPIGLPVSRAVVLARQKKNKRFGKQFYNRAVEVIPDAFHRFGSKLKRRNGASKVPIPDNSDLVVRTSTSGSSHSGGTDSSAPGSDASLIQSQRH
jgi:hypothetical protein